MAVAEDIEWEAIDQAGMHFKQTNEYDLVKNRSASEIVDTHRSTLASTCQLMDKELSRCAKVERALEVMYKMYFARDASFKDKLRELNTSAQKLNLDKEVFTTF